MPWVVLLVSLLITTGATIFVAITARDRDLARFRNAVQSTNDRIMGRLDVYVATLRGAAGLFAVQDTVTRHAFETYTDRLDLQRLYPGIQGIGWTQRIAYRPGAEVEEVHAIRFLQPLDARNAAALGYDMFSEPTRREAMRAARDQGTAAMSGRVRLVQEIYGRQQAGFLIYLPVFEGGSVPATVAERRRRLRGFVYSPFRADDLFAGIFGSEFEPRVSFRVYDGTTPDSATLLHASAASGGHQPALTDSRRLRMLDRTWTVEYASEPPFERSSTTYLLPLTALAGFLASLWLFWLARGQTRARLSAESANRAKSDFLAVMSHELRTPLNAIGGYADLMVVGVGGQLAKRHQQYVARIQHAQRHLLGLINDVLNFAKVGAGRVSYQMQYVPVGPIVMESYQLMAAQADAKRLTYRLEQGPDVRVFADVEKVRQVLLNLLSNAIKFTAGGGAVTVSWSAADERVEVTVADTGPGVPREHQERIFDPFVQVDADLTRQQQGTGLGLAIARDLAMGMGGDILLESETERGSRFTLVLRTAGTEDAAG